jgi:hypothetical protein
MFSKSVVLGAALCLAAVPAQAALVLDQSTIITATTGTEFNASSIRSSPFVRLQSQSITAGKTGLLSRVDVQVVNISATAGLIVSIASGILNEPGYSPLGSFVVPYTSVPTLAQSYAGALVSVDVSSLDFNLAAGDVFSIMISSQPSELGGNLFGWVLGETLNGDLLNPVQEINYAGGYNQISDNGGATWFTSGADRGFATWVDTGAVPEPASWAMLIAGFGLTGATLRRRRMAAA